jgi:hypothetical protein
MRWTPRESKRRLPRTLQVFRALRSRPEPRGGLASAALASQRREAPPGRAAARTGRRAEGATRTPLGDACAHRNRRRAPASLPKSWSPSRSGCPHTPHRPATGRPAQVADRIGPRLLAGTWLHRSLFCALPAVRLRVVMRPRTSNSASLPATRRLRLLRPALLRAEVRGARLLWPRRSFAAPACRALRSRL